VPSDAAIVRRFRRVAAEYFSATNERFPEQASRLGYAKFNALLGANDAPTHRAQTAAAVAAVREVEDLPEAAFSGDDWLDRRTFLAMVRTEVLQGRDLLRWQNNPQASPDTAVDALFDLVVRHATSLGRVLPAIESRLEKIPDFLAAGADAVKRPVPLWTKLAEQSCAGAVTFLHEIEPELCRHANDPAATRRRMAAAVRAFQDYARSVSRKAPGPTRGYAIGRTHFELLMRERLGFDLSLPETRANGRRLVERLQAELAAEARRLGGKSARQVLDAAAEAWTPQRPLLDLYREVTKGLKSRLRRLGLMTLPPGEDLQVLAAPAFLRHHFPTAAYNAPPPFSPRQVGIFWVNDLSLGLADPERKRAEIRQHFGLELTAAHEGYPGHHLQFAVQNRHPSPIRRQAGHSIFYEGWTMWCERLAVENGLVDHPQARLIQLHDALWRAYRILIDCGLHDGSLDFSAACRVLQDGVGFTRARAAGDVNWYTASPTVPMSYLLGRIEVEKLHARFVGREGWTLPEFHDWMLSHGAIPWAWIVQAHDRQ
jgi:uncharacterized protein (DUF885 family)